MRQKFNRGTYFAQTGVHSINAAADGLSDGRWLLINPVNSGRMILLIDAVMSCQLIDGTVTTTCPRIQLERFSFTGTTSGSKVTICPLHITRGQNHIGEVVTSNSGLKMTMLGAFWAYLTLGVIKIGSGVTQTAELHSPVFHHLDSPFENKIMIEAGEGIICRQPDVGMVNDPRRYITNIIWGEESQ